MPKDTIAELGRGEDLTRRADLDDWYPFERPDIDSEHSNQDDTDERESDSARVPRRGKLPPEQDRQPGGKPERGLASADAVGHWQ